MQLCASTAVGSEMRSAGGAASCEVLALGYPICVYFASLSVKAGISPMMLKKCFGHSICSWWDWHCCRYVCSQITAASGFLRPCARRRGKPRVKVFYAGFLSKCTFRTEYRIGVRAWVCVPPACSFFVINKRFLRMQSSRRVACYRCVSLVLVMPAIASFSC